MFLSISYTISVLLDNHHHRHRLLRACVRAYLPSFLSPIIPRLCVTAFKFSQPLLIDTTVNFVEQREPDTNFGKGLIGAWALVCIGIAVSTSIYQYQNFRFVTRLRGGLIALVYERTVQIRAVDMGETTPISLMGTDIERIVDSMQMFHSLVRRQGSFLSGLFREQKLRISVPLVSAPKIWL
jgi:ATP-binding cassette subfamily C (CFTR/MRP) protein 1